MKFGVWIPNCRHLATPAIIRNTAVRAEFLSEDGRVLDEQMDAFASEVRPALA